MKMGIFSVRDRVAMRHETLILAQNAPMAIRQNYKFIKQDPTYNDLELWELGEMDSETGIIKPLEPKQHSWDEYKFPENKVEPTQTANMKE